MIQSLRRAVALQLICDDDAGHVLQTLQQLAEELLRCFLTSLTLHQDIKDVAILVYGSPQIMILAVDLQEHFIQVPFAAGSRTSSAKLVSGGLAELSAPFSNSFIGERDATHCHDLFDIAEALAQSGSRARPEWLMISAGKQWRR